MLGVAGSNNFSSPRKINAYVEPMNQVNFTHYVFTKYVFANFSGDTAHRTFQTNVTGPDGKSVVVNHNATGSAGAAVPFFEPQPHALPGREIVFTFPDPCAPATSWDSCSKYFYSMTSFEIVPIQAIP